MVRARLQGVRRGSHRRRSADTLVFVFSVHLFAFRGAVEVDGGRPESGPLHAESSRDRPTWRPIARSDRKPGLEDLAGRIRGLTIWAILQRALQQDPISGRSYPCVLPVRLPRLPCSAVKNSLIFFQLGKDGMDEAKCFAPVRLGFERPLGQRLPVNLPVSSEFRGRPVRYGLLPQPAIPGFDAAVRANSEKAANLGPFRDYRDTRDRPSS
jgi:hypothetical protein